MTSTVTKTELKKQASKPEKINRPEIRMTLTTKLRLLKANPHMQLDKSNLSSKSSLSDIAKANDINLNTVMNYKDCFLHPRPIVRTAFHKRLLNEAKKPIEPRRNTVASRVLPRNTSVKSEFKKPLLTALGKNTKTIRRSISFNGKPRSSSTPKRKTAVSSMVESQPGTPSFRKIAQETNETSVSSPTIFKTPSAYKRRSVASTPITAAKPPTNQLRNDLISKRLRDWLSRRGKSLGEFQHLKCFGLHEKVAGLTSEDEDDYKENVETAVVDRGSYEDLRLGRAEEAEEARRKDEKCEELNEIAKAALVDLHNLILEGYPAEQCDIWLDLIQKKSKSLEEEPEYWECRAALEQSRGNITSAVECYKTAIVQGAEVNKVDDHLDHLLQKFSLLDIAKESGKKLKPNSRDKMINDARNIFKSSIIQFAVQERKLKKKQTNDIFTERKLTATPVRRSTRKSRSAYSTTPGVKVYETFKGIEENSVDFQCNNALLN